MKIARPKEIKMSSNIKISRKAISRYDLESSVIYHKRMKEILHREHSTMETPIP